ncbi:MAG: hypothetical protein PVI23_09970 [Maricaulaceae bacterium]|jgi:hypothetical protein
MNKYIPIAAAAFTVLLTAPACAQSQALSGALEESAEAVGAGIEASGKTASAVAAVPISAAGVASGAVGSVAEAAGAAAAQVGQETMEAGAAALEYANEPLTIGDEVIVTAAEAPNVPYRPEPDADASDRR